MNYTQIIKRAWQILWHYPALWVIGILLAFVGGSNGFNPIGQSRFEFDQNNNFRDFRLTPTGEFAAQIEQFNRFMDSHFGNINVSTVITWMIIAGLILLLLVVVTVIVKYIALTANIRMVDHLESTGEKVSWRKGLRWGWSRSAFRMWLISLVIIIPTIIVFMLLFGCAAIPVLLGIAGGERTTAVGIVATIGIGFLVFFIVFIAGVVISLWLRFARRECVINQRGVMESIRLGWQTLRKEIKDILVMWLLLSGIRIGVTIALIPVVLILLAIAAALAGGVGLLLNSIAANMTLTAILVGIALFILLLAVPMLFVNGLKETYFETSWTLVFRETQTRIENQIRELPEEPAAA